LFLATAAGCTNISLRDAADLANVGTKAARAYALAILQTSGSLDQFVEAQYLTAPLQHLPEPDLAPPEGKVNCSGRDLSTGENIECIKEALDARRVMLIKLADLYSSFGALTSYNAQQNVNEALTDLSGSIDQFAQALGQPGMPAGADVVSADVGGVLASQIQKRKVKRASKAIRQRLEVIIPLIEKERATMESLQRVLVQDAGVTAVVLYRNGIGAPDPILANNIGTFGLSYEPGSYSHACETLRGQGREECMHNFEKGIREVVLLRAKRRARDQVAVIDSNAAAIKALSDAHSRMEDGQPINLALVTQQLMTLRTIVDDLNSSLKANQ